jgi:MFS superfamily sulfate permease-like transporter
MSPLTLTAAIGYTFIGAAIGVVAGILIAMAYGVISEARIQVRRQVDERIAREINDEEAIRREIRDKVTELVHAIIAKKGITIDGHDKSNK